MRCFVATTHKPIHTIRQELGAIILIQQMIATYEQAIKGDKPGIWIYCASKKLTERAAFDYAKEHPELKITTINLDQLE